MEEPSCPSRRNRRQSARRAAGGGDERTWRAAAPDLQCRRFQPLRHRRGAARRGAGSAAMSELKITEAGSVQFPMVAHAAAIGWTAIPPEVAKQKRGGEAGMLFRDELEDVLARFNPWLSADAVRQLIEKLEAIPPTVEGNREMLSWLRGERQWYDEAEKRHRHIQLIDFEAPADNTFHVTWEWKLKPPARKGNRADLMFVVNGIPVCVVEHKNPKDGGAIERGITQLRRYEKETPELLGAPQLFNVTHLLDYWYGVTWNANRRFMARWKQEREETYRFAVQSFFEPTDFLRTLPALDPVLCRGRRDAEIGAAAAPAHCHRQDRRALRRRGQEARSCLAYP